jgi:hypothetical protein
MIKFLATFFLGMFTFLVILAYRFVFCSSEDWEGFIHEIDKIRDRRR